MNPESYSVRRATVDDLPQLRTLWDAGHLPSLELDKRFTEFQVAITPAGTIAGAVGLHVEKSQGLIHNEVYQPPQLADEIRPLFWNRLQNIARNHGLHAVWTLATTSFFRQHGMVEPDGAMTNKLPATFGHPNAGWLVLKLREDGPPPVSLENEFALFTQTQKAETESLFRQAQFIRALAYAFLTIVLIALAVAGIFVFTNLRRLRKNRK